MSAVIGNVAGDDIATAVRAAVNDRVANLARRIAASVDGHGFVPEALAAEYLRVDKKTLYRMRNAKVFEPDEYRSVKGSWRYSLDALDRWLTDQNGPENY